jgi:hypothetical protein
LRSGTSTEFDVERALQQALAALEADEDRQVVAAFVEAVWRIWAPNKPPLPTPRSPMG